MPCKLLNPLQLAKAVTAPGVDIYAVTKSMAERYLAEDLAANKALGDFGALAIKAAHPSLSTFNLATICNTGSLATAGHGTALGIIRSLHATNSVSSVAVLETRPYNQGARLTAFEAVEEGWPNSTLIVDSATPSYMDKTTVHAAVVGADRVVSNGDTANKIGTYHLAVHCRCHGVPFYVACPTTTIDLGIGEGKDIHIEERPADELRSASGAPYTIGTWNPAFDVTPASLITGIVTEKGVIYPSSDETFDVKSFLADPSSSPPPPTSLPSALMAPTPPLLTPETVPAYVCGRLSSLPLPPPPTTPSDLTAEEIHGGNLNYAFRVRHTKSGKEVFVKQAPDFVKCLGSSAKMSKERMELEVLTYETWSSTAPSVSKYLPEIYDFNPAGEIVVMEFLGTCEMLEHRLITNPTFNPSISRGLGEFMSSTHAATHSSKVGWGEAAKYHVKFLNSDLRGLQLEYVFTKAFKEGGDLASPLSSDAIFMKGVKEIKSLYMAESGSSLALCHGDLHPGSVMIDDAQGYVKVIDPEFAVYAPPGLDLGSLLSGVVLAAMHHKHDPSGSDPSAVGRLRAFAGSLVEAYVGGPLPPDATDAAVRDALGFCACEVARTALGFAGGRLWLQFKDAGVKERALKATVEVARGLMNERGKGVEALMQAFG